MISICRLLLAATLLFMAIADDELFGFAPESDDILAAIYLYLAASRLVVLASSWWLNFRFRLVGLAIDCAFYLLHMYLVEPMHTGSFSMTVAMLSFLIVSVGITWGWRHALALAIIANLLCLAMIVQMAAMDMPMAPLLRRQAYQLLISAFLVWTMTFAQLHRLVAVRLPPDLTTSQTFQQMLDVTLSQSGSSSAAIVWLPLDDTTFQATAFQRRSGFAFDPSGYTGEFAISLPGPAMFDAKLRRAVMLNPAGRLKTTNLGFEEREFAQRSGIDSGVFIPLSGASGSGWLVYDRPSFAGVEHLRLALEIGTGIADAFDNQSILRSAERRAAEQQRTALARDMHDSLSQSFAGARFWLKSLLTRIPKKDPIHTEINQMADLFQTEQAQVQRMIESLRGEQPHLSVGGLDRRIELIRQQLSQIWSMDIATSIALSQHAVPDWALSEVPLMVREALANAARHGRASKASIDLEVRDDAISLVVEDNGTGMASAKIKPASLTQRAELRGGTLDLSSKPGSTRVEITLPVGEG